MVNFKLWWWIILKMPPSLCRDRKIKMELINYFPNTKEISQTKKRQTQNVISVFLY